MAVATTERKERARRTSEEWKRLARTEIAPRLRKGEPISDLTTEYGAAVYRALALAGFDTDGRRISRVEITGARPATLANRVAKRRREGVAWYRIEVETGKYTRELRNLLAEHGYDEDGTRKS